LFDDDDVNEKDDCHTKTMTGIVQYSTVYDDEDNENDEMDRSQIRMDVEEEKDDGLDQCCGSGSEIRIRDEFCLDLGSRIFLTMTKTLLLIT
jgi:hypothetical protein